MLNSNEDVNTKKENLITLYPFNGHSPYLIDKFYIIGYNYLTLEKLLINNTPKVIAEEKEKDMKEPHNGSFEMEEEPMILNEFTNDYIKEGLDSKTIIQMIYPNKLKCYYTWEENTSYMLKRTIRTKVFNLEDDINDFPQVEFNSSSGEVPKSSRVIFSSNPQTGKNSKKSINGLAYIFYVKYKKTKKLDKRKYIYYIPYTFCITSEYPYFSSFDKLLKCIKKLYSQDSIYIPIEIIIYNIISLSPSPLNADVIIDLKSTCEQETIFGNLLNLNRYKSKDLTPNMTLTNDINSSNKNVRRRWDNDDKKSKFPISFRRNNTQVINADDIESDDIYRIEFNFLSGYPLIQYNLPKVLFYNISIEKIITIYLFMFLEKDILFFSRDIEYLTLTINAYLNLSFPLNDEKYYFIGCAISFDDFIKGDSEFGLKNYTSLIGINDSFKPNYRNKNIKINDHLVVDLDKGDVIYGEDLKNQDNVNEKNKRLMKLIEKMCKETGDDEKIKAITLYQAINKLSKHLKMIYEKIYDPSIKSIPGKLFDFNQKTIYKANKEIQESFYEFINNVCLYFYENLTIKATEDEYKYDKNQTKKDEKESEMNVIFDDSYKKNNIYNEEELIFLEELKTTMKYESFVFGFLQSYNPIDLFKVPLTFTEEFLSIISRKREEIRGNTYNIKFFKLIDELYFPRKAVSPTQINFMIYNASYCQNFKAKFDREIFDRSKKRFNFDNTIMVKSILTGDKTLFYQTYELDDNILLDYIHLTKNLSLNEYAELFSSTFLIEENTLNEIDITNIETRIENNCIKEKILTNSDICCANILILFTISLKSLRETIDCQEFLSILFQKFTVFRKYYSILLRMVYKLCETGKDKKNSKIANTALCYYPCINSIRVKKLVPNEDLMNMIKNFNKIDINEFSLQENEAKEKKEENLGNIDLYGEKLEEKEINYKNLYIFNNFNSQQFFSEKAIVDYVNSTNQDEISTNTGEIIYPRIRFYNGIHKIESFFMSQKIMLEGLMKEYNKYIETLDTTKLTSKIILDACLNIFIYMRNNEEFEGMDDIFETLKSIFYIYMNQLFILKSEKENDIKKKYSS